MTWMFVALGTHVPLCTWSLSSPASRYSFTHIPRIWKLVNSQGNQALTYCCISICYIFFILRSAAWYLRYCSSAVILSEGRDGKPYGRTCCPKKNCEVQGTGSWKTWGSNITRHRKGSIQVAWSFVASLVSECWRILQVFSIFTYHYRIQDEAKYQVSWLPIRSSGQIVEMLAFSFCFRFPTMHAVMQTWPWDPSTIRFTGMVNPMLPTEMEQHPLWMRCVPAVIWLL